MVLEFLYLSGRLFKSIESILQGGWKNGCV